MQIDFTITLASAARVTTKIPGRQLDFDILWKDPWAVFGLLFIASVLLPEYGEKTQ